MFIRFIFFALFILLCQGDPIFSVIEQKGPANASPVGRKKYILLPLECTKTLDLSELCEESDPYLIQAELLDSSRYGTIKLDNDLLTLEIHREPVMDVCEGFSIVNIKYDCKIPGHHS